METSPLANLSRPADVLLDGTARELTNLEELRGRSPDEVGRRFEELFATMLVREFRKTLPEGFFGGGAGADTYESWMDEHLGRALAEQDTLGLAGIVKTATQRLAGGAEPATPAEDGG